MPEIVWCRWATHWCLTVEVTGVPALSARPLELRVIRAPGTRAATEKETTMDFGAALQELKRGNKVERSGWNGKGLWLELQTPDENSKMTLPYIYINYPSDAKTTPGARVPWLASQTDMLAEDWSITA